jgi:general secretion pathway protein G
MSDEPARFWMWAVGDYERRVRKRWLRIGFWLSLAPALFAGCLSLMVQHHFERPDPTSTARNQAFEIGKSIELYNLQAGAYPWRLKQLVEPPRGKPIFERLPVDPWGRPFRYEIPGWHNPQKFDVFSVGEDGVAYSADDQGNWPDN